MIIIEIVLGFIAIIIGILLIIFRSPFSKAEAYYYTNLGIGGWIANLFNKKNWYYNHTLRYSYAGCVVFGFIFILIGLMNIIMGLINYRIPGL